MIGGGRGFENIIVNRKEIPVGRELTERSEIERREEASAI